jgi:formylglycine-generating enzyme required for sulfatase activity
MPGKQLMSPVADCQDVSEELRRIGYRLIGGGPLLQPSREALGAAVKKLSEEAKSAECVTFYFSGHGMEIGDDVYMIPNDMPMIRSPAQVSEGSLSLVQTVMAGLVESGVETKVLILDCCRDNPFEGGVPRPSGLADGSSKRGYGRGFYVAYATSPGAEAFDGNGARNSPFTESFVGCLRTIADKDVDLFFRDVKRRMPPDQVSWTKSSLDKEFSLGVRGKTGLVNSLPVKKTSTVSTSYQTGRKAGERLVVGGIPVRWCPPGEFVMGSGQEEKGVAKKRGVDAGDEVVHRVSLSDGFYLAETECTQAVWTAVMGGNPSFDKGPRLPVERVSWAEAVTFCQKLTQQQRLEKRLSSDWKWTLPTEAQWEYAARAGSKQAFYGDIKKIAAVRVPGALMVLKGSVDVAGRIPNAWGIHDTIGNVWEWCADWYGKYDVKQGKTLTDPMGGASGAARVYRGGSWDNVPEVCRVAARGKSPPGNKYYFLGFRPALVRLEPVLEAKALRVEKPRVESKAGGGDMRSGAKVGSGQGNPPANAGAAEMVLVKGGVLPKGSGLAGQVVQEFQMGKYEVTWGLWKSVRDWATANGYSLVEGGTHPKGGVDSLPVVNVSWFSAIKWCNARSEKEGRKPVYWVSGAIYRTGDSVPSVDASANGYRLPSEREWEWAARGGAWSKDFRYSGGNVIDDAAWYALNSRGSAKVVGTRPANEAGIYDMSGNVWEWCWDEDTAHRGKGFRRERGGGWSDKEGFCAVAFRGFRAPSSSRTNLGFRVALGPMP